ncbi:MAG: hypothetical protein SVT52_05045 [Planctomycetota bacterium]|nr:hypothetical protein [Planctomycetota bacterium]
MMHLGRRIFWVMAVAAVTAGAVGCAASDMKVVAADAVLPANEDSAAFLDRISSRLTVTENDAMRGVLMLVDGKDTAGSFQQRLESLLARKVISSRWSYDAGRPVTRGKVAYMICQATKIPGGVMMRLTGPNQRYCLRELQYQRLMVAGSTFTPVTGMEFVDAISRADTYIRTGKTPNVLGDVE